MKTIYAPCGPIRYPEGGGMTAATGENVIELALSRGAKAKQVHVTTIGNAEVRMNGEILEPDRVEDDVSKYGYKKEIHSPGNQVTGGIESLTITGNAQFSVIIEE